jgi:hypothetical protein
MGKNSVGMGSNKDTDGNMGNNKGMDGNMDRMGYQNRNQIRNQDKLNAHHRY